MFGFMLALLYVAWLTIVEHISYEVAYLTATGFLYNWYFWWSIILGVFVVIFALILPFIGLGAGLKKGGGLLAFGGMLLGGAVSFLGILVFAIRRGLWVGGAYLLHGALTLNHVNGNSIATWDKNKLILGGLLLLVALVTSRSSSSNSSSSKSS